MVLRKIVDRVVDHMVRPLARRKVKQILKENLRNDLIFAFLVLIGALSIAWYFGSGASEITDYFLIAIGIIATFRLARVMYKFSKYYKESSWLMRRVLRVCMRSILTDRFILLLIAGYILLVTLVWLGRSIGVVWLLN